MTHDVYLQYADSPIVRTRELVLDGRHTGLMADLNAEGEVIGVEALGVATVVVDGKTRP